MSEEVLFEIANGVARVTINRPERRNAMSYGVMAGLRDSMKRARADDAVRVVGQLGRAAVIGGGAPSPSSGPLET